MKRSVCLFTFLTSVLFVVFSCSKFDDSKLWDAINKNSQEIAELKTLCRQINSDIQNLRTLVTAVENGDYITHIAPLSDNSGYSITMKKYGTIVIKNGEKGDPGTNGRDGTDGTNGRDGNTPVITVAKDSDGLYYWKVNGEWLLDSEGNKVKAVGIDGSDGTNGTDGDDGLTPQLDIIDGYWYVSYDGEHWEKLGKATGDNGLNGDDGDSVFKTVSVSDGYVVFTLNDAEGTIIKIPFYTDTMLMLTTIADGMLQDLISDSQERTTISLSVAGPLNSEDIMFIRYHLTALEYLDLGNATIDDIPKDGFNGMRRLKKVILPDTVNTIGNNAFVGCNLLTTLVAKRAVVSASAITDCPYIQTLNIGAVSGSYENYELSVTLNGDRNGDIASGTVSVDSLFFGPSVKTITKSTVKNSYHIVFDPEAPIEEISDDVFQEGQLQSIILPKHLKTLGGRAFRNCAQLSSVTFPVDCEISSLKGDYYAGTTSAWIFGAFEGCSLLTKIALPSNLTELSGGVFYDNTSITEVEILGSEADLDLSGLRITYYGGYYTITSGAFPIGMKKLIIHRRIPPICNDDLVFDGLEKEKCTLYVPASSVTRYQSSSNWNDFREILPIE